jgi:hypothetical protein
MVAMVAEDEQAAMTVPPTIQALLAARLDQLEPAARGVLERGAVEGQVFHRGAVVALAPDEPEVDGRLIALVRKDLVRPEAAVLANDEAYRFRHLLIRDTAYVNLNLVRAEIARLAGQPDAEREALEKALPLAEEKGCLVAAEQIRERLGEL